LFENLNYLQHDRERFQAGMNPVTLLAEHKRKVILNALTELPTEVNESRSVSQSKLANYIENKAIEESSGKNGKDYFRVSVSSTTSGSTNKDLQL